MPCHEFCGLGHSADARARCSGRAARKQLPARPDGKGRPVLRCNRRLDPRPSLGRVRGLRRRRPCSASGRCGCAARCPRPVREPAELFPLGDRARRGDGLRADDLFHHGLRLLRRGNGAGPAVAGPGLGLGRLRARRGRRRDGSGDHLRRPRLGALHLLSAADRGAPGSISAWCWWSPARGSGAC